MWVGGLEWEREVLGGEEIEWVERDREKWSWNHAEAYI